MVASSISPQNFITDVLNTVDNVVGNFVQTGFTHLIQDNSATITALMVLYVMGLGYRLMTHTLSMEQGELVRHLVLLCIIYGLLMSWDLYYLFFFNLFTNEPGAISKSLVDGSGMLPPGKDGAAALNAAFSQGMDAASLLMAVGSALNPMPWIYALLVVIMTLAYGILALLLFVYAKMALSVILVLGPIFLIFLLWNSTRGLFDKWLQTLINYALVPVVTSAILMLVLAIGNTLLPGLSKMSQSGDPQFSGIWPYLGFCLLSAFLFKQVLSICAALSGGLSLENISGAAPIANSALKYSGLKSGASKAASGAKNLASKAMNNFKNKRADKKERATQAKARQPY